MQINRAGSKPSKPGPADWFTGTVRIDSPFQGEEPSHISGATVTFEPGARTAWHTHSLGQTILITSGLGWVQRDGGPVEEVRPGDIVWFSPPGEAIMNISFENKVALVTGAASGLGLATAKAFAEAGASVVLADQNENAVKAAAEELKAKGYKVLAAHCDVSDDAQVEAMVTQTVDTFGKLDAAYNNAGIQN